MDVVQALDAERVPDDPHGLARDDAGAPGSLDDRVAHQTLVARIARAALADRVEKAVERDRQPRLDLDVRDCSTSISLLQLLDLGAIRIEGV